MRRRKEDQADPLTYAKVAILRSPVLVGVTLALIVLSLCAFPILVAVVDNRHAAEATRAETKQIQSYLVLAHNANIARIAIECGEINELRAVFATSYQGLITEVTKALAHATPEQRTLLLALRAIHVRTESQLGQLDCGALAVSGPQAP